LISCSTSARQSFNNSLFPKKDPVTEDALLKRILEATSPEPWKSSIQASSRREESFRFPSALFANVSSKNPLVPVEVDDLLPFKMLEVEEIRRSQISREGDASTQLEPLSFLKTSFEEEGARRELSGAEGVGIRKSLH